jgi:hypothetical protein
LKKINPVNFLQERLSSEHKTKKYKKIQKIMNLVQNHCNENYKVKKQKGNNLLIVFTQH